MKMVEAFVLKKKPVQTSFPRSVGTGCFDFPFGHPVVNDENFSSGVALL